MIEDIRENILTYIQIYQQSPFKLITLIVDITIVIFLAYGLLKIVKDSRAWQLVKGIAFLVIATWLSGILNLNILNYILSAVMNWGVILLIIIFQPEIRRALEQLGTNKFTKLFGMDKDIATKTKEDIYKIAIAATELSKSKTGGLIVIERDIKIKDIVSQFGYEVSYYKVLPDDKETLSNEMKKLCDENLVDIILTTGGTGFSKRDNTPEATLEIAEKLVPGISEAVRNYSMQFTKKAMLSRAVSVIRKETLIINMPGSSKAVKESMECIMPALNHGLDILKGTASECARK